MMDETIAIYQHGLQLQLHFTPDTEPELLKTVLEVA
jgi:hypothetical protein